MKWKSRGGNNRHVVVEGKLKKLNRSEIKVVNCGGAAGEGKGAVSAKHCVLCFLNSLIGTFCARTATRTICCVQWTLKATGNKTCVITLRLNNFESQASQRFFLRQHESILFGSRRSPNHVAVFSAPISSRRPHNLIPWNWLPVSKQVIVTDIQIQPGLKAKLSIIFIVCSNKIKNRVMLSGEGMQRRKTVKNNNTSNQQKQLCICITLFLYISLSLFCTTIT